MTRVVVTGLGLVTPLGLGTKHVWKRLIDGHSGITLLDKEKFKTPSLVGALVPRGIQETEYDSARYFKDDRQLSPFIQFAIAASDEALADSGWTNLTQEQKDDTGVCIGSGIGSIEDISQQTQNLIEKGPRRVSPFFVPRMLANLAAGHVSIRNGFTGPNHCPATACTTGAHAIGDAMRWIQYGDCKVVVCGGSEASVTPLGVAGFSQLRALSTAFNDRPEESSRPFDTKRDGFVIGEGSGALVLEDMDHAIQRGARIYCEIVGYGMSGGKYATHITAPPADGRGAQKAMRRALQVAKIEPSAIDYMNAHATSTPLGDIAESVAVHNVMGPVKTSSTKGAIGHLLGAAGAVEAIFAIKAIETQTLPLTRNLENVDPQCAPLQFLKESVQTEVRYTMTNSFGFGGTNASLVFKRY
ncbi:3-oxoacyl-synthase II [Gorgonomyces haynaldii]|nr:3-oxoacyl-synthase II [Gorgonomyces haynaldii]